MHVACMKRLLSIVFSLSATRQRSAVENRMARSRDDRASSKGHFASCSADLYSRFESRRAGEFTERGLQGMEHPECHVWTRGVRLKLGLLM